MVKIRGGLFLPPPKPRIAVVPNNFGMDSHANQEIERTIEVANQRFNTALRVDGIPVMIWRKTEEGHICTCKTQEPVIEDNSASEGSAAPTPSNIIRVQGSELLSETRHMPQDNVLGVDLRKPDIENGRGADFTTFDNDFLESKGPGAEFLDNTSLHQFLDSGTSTTTCGICFGTGYTNGYSLYGGQRLVFESHNLIDNDGFSIKENSEPLVYIGDTGARLEWAFRVPAFFKAFWLTARNNTKAAYVSIEVNGAPLPLDGLNGFKNQIVTLSATALVEETELTHVELVLQFIDWPFTQADNISEETNYTSIEPTQTLDFPFSPSVQRLNKKDAFVDLKFGKVWRINSVTDFKSSSGQMISWQASATSRTSFDILSLLKVVMQPSYELSFENIDFL